MCILQHVASMIRNERLYQHCICLAGLVAGFYAGDSYYRLFAQPRIWTHARQLCLDRGGYLAELSTGAELEAVILALGRLCFTLKKAGPSSICWLCHSQMLPRKALNFFSSHSIRIFYHLLYCGVPLSPVVHKSTEWLYVGLGDFP